MFIVKVLSPQAPTDQDYEVIVAFKGESGIKKLLYSYAPLEKVE